MARAAIDGASASRAVARSLRSPDLAPLFKRPLHVIAVGKAAASMANAMAEHASRPPTTLIATGTHRGENLSTVVEWHESAHPMPDARSVAAAERALEVAAAVSPDECLTLLISGGASALMALPLPGITLANKRDCIRTMMLAGADIHSLNAVRKHLSAVKGGRLAVACRGITLTLAVSDVVGDDLSVIGSGPGVADVSTWQDAARALEQYGGAGHPRAVRELIAQGVRGTLPETPKAGDPALARAHAHVIASPRHALDAAAQTAQSLGYHVVESGDAVTGEARDAALRWFKRVTEVARHTDTPLCVLSAGETTVRVTGAGRGGRNQEFVLALVDDLAGYPRDVLIASLGTDGIDGPTDAAGAMADRTTRDRALALGLSSAQYLQDNNSYDFFSVLGDLVHLGRTDTNVGDVQILLMGGDRD